MTASIAAASPNPFSMMSQPSAASAVAMPSPIPLVEPVTIAILPLSIGVLLSAPWFYGCSCLA